VYINKSQNSLQFGSHVVNSVYKHKLFLESQLDKKLISYLICNYFLKLYVYVILQYVWSYKNYVTIFEV
jgi:hypothetical protein